MKFRIKFDVGIVLNNSLREQLDAHLLEYTIVGNSEVHLKKKLSSIERERLDKTLAEAGMEIIADDKGELVERIKEVISEMIYTDLYARRYTVSNYLSEKLNYSYSHLANCFSETTFTSIESFIILKKVDYAKSLIIDEGLTLTEIAHRLNYSSVAHLSGQFKKVTGLTPTTFQSIVKERKRTRKNTRELKENQ